MTGRLGAWEACYELGIEDIDLQHHFFFNLINRLARELLQTDNVQHRGELINELNAYAKFHFISEENMMRKSAYPHFLHHQGLHVELIEQLSTRGSMLFLPDAQGAVESIVTFLGEWFLQHTREVDRQFARYLLEAPIEDSRWERPQQPKAQSKTNFFYKNQSGVTFFPSGFRNKAVGHQRTSRCKESVFGEKSGG